MKTLYGGGVLRTVLSDSYSYVRSTEANQSASAVTLDHILSEQINFLKKDATRDMVDGQGSAVGKRPSRWDRIDSLEKMLKATLDVISSAGDDKAKLVSIGIYEADLLGQKDTGTKL